MSFISPRTSHFLTLRKAWPSPHWIHLFLGGVTPPTQETVWRPRHQSQKSPQMSCPMTKAAVSSVCQLRDTVSHENLIIAQEWRKGEEWGEVRGDEQEASRLSAGRVSARSPRPGSTGEQYHPGRHTGAHSLRKPACCAARILGATCAQAKVAQKIPPPALQAREAFTPTAGDLVLFCRKQRGCYPCL